MKTLKDYKKHPNWKKIKRLAAKIEVVSNAGKGQPYLIVTGKRGRRKKTSNV